MAEVITSFCERRSIVGSDPARSAAQPAEIIVFPKVNLLELRDLWTTIKAEIDANTLLWTARETCDRHEAH